MKKVIIILEILILIGIINIGRQGLEFKNKARYYKQKYLNQVEISKNWNEKCQILEDDLNQQN